MVCMARQRQKCCAGVGATECSFFYNLELASAEGSELVYTRAHVDSYIEPTELQVLAADGSNEAWAGRIAVIRRIPGI